MPALTAKTSKRLGRRHRTALDRTEEIIQRVRRWQPECEIVLVGDGAYACVRLLNRCRDRQPAVRLVTRLRLDAGLYDPPGPQPKGKRGPKPTKGPRQRRLHGRVADLDDAWQELTVGGYGGPEKTLQVQSEPVL